MFYVLMNLFATFLRRKNSLEYISHAEKVLVNMSNVKRKILGQVIK